MRKVSQQALSFLSFQAIPRKSGSIKEQTIISYVLEAAVEGHELNWARFSKEIGLTLDTVQQIRFALTKVGSRERLKPIKEELPETVSITFFVLIFPCGFLNSSVFSSFSY